LHRIPLVGVVGALIMATIVGDAIYCLVWRRTSSLFGASVLLMPRSLGLTFVAALIVLIELRWWRNATRRVKTIAVIVFFVVVPFKYWTIHNWDRVTGRSRLFSEVTNSQSESCTSGALAGTEPAAQGRRLAPRDVGGSPPQSGTIAAAR